MPVIHLTHVIYLTYAIHLKQSIHFTSILFIWHALFMYVCNNSSHTVAHDIHLSHAAFISHKMQIIKI